MIIIIWDWTGPGHTEPSGVHWANFELKGTRTFQRPLSKHWLRQPELNGRHGAHRTTTKPSPSGLALPLVAVAVRGCPHLSSVSSPVPGAVLACPRAILACPGLSPGPSWPVLVRPGLSSGLSPPVPGAVLACPRLLAALTLLQRPGCPGGCGCRTGLCNRRSLEAGWELKPPPWLPVGHVPVHWHHLHLKGLNPRPAAAATDC